MCLCVGGWWRGTRQLRYVVAASGCSGEPRLRAFFGGTSATPATIRGDPLMCDVFLHPRSLSWAGLHIILFFAPDLGGPWPTWPCRSSASDCTATASLHILILSFNRNGYRQMSTIVHLRQHVQHFFFELRDTPPISSHCMKKTR